MIFTIRTATIPNCPSRNGVIYSEESIKKAFNKAKEKGPIYIEMYNNNDTYYYTMHFNEVKLENIIGEVIDNDFKGLLTVDIYDDKVDLFKTLISSGYKAGMRYYGYSEEKNGDNTKILIDNLISYETIPYQ